MPQKEEEQRHEASAHDLLVIPVGATVAKINKDLKTWSVGKVEKYENWFYVILTEDDRLISHNCVHLWGTNVSFLPKSSRLDVPPAQQANKYVSLKPSNINTKSGQPVITPKPKVKPTPASTPPRVELRTRSGRLVKKPPNLTCSFKL